MKNLLAATLLLFCLLGVNTAHAQADRTLTISDLLTWQASSSNADNISNEVLARTAKTGFQAKAGLDTNGRILYCPDGMNNFGPYTDSAAQFNLFNFSHWQYIDILCWFGGSASEPILIPSKAWVDAAHKNGVKVIGTIFFAPAVYGGSQAQVQQFLAKDVNNHFIAAQKLREIADYYHFDGWIFNCETSVNQATATLFMDFLTEFDSTYTGENIWYDSMISTGSISYQNRLNSTNGWFFQHATGIFTNYVWSANATVTSSATYATSVGRSPYDCYTGADMWPGRTAQPAFSNYLWIDKIYQSGVAKTSTAMFAMNFTYNYSNYSNFNNDPNDYDAFYATERKIFSGVDEDPFTVDAQWKGLVNYTAVRTPITAYPFSTTFNTGHGLNYYYAGAVLNPTAWHNMSHQSSLPSWTFYKTGVTMTYDFTTAWEGGSSLKIDGAAAGSYSIPLYSTYIPTPATQLDADLAVFTGSNAALDSINIELVLKSGQVISTPFHPTTPFNWQLLQNTGIAIGNDTIVEVKLHIYANNAFSLNVGKMGFNAPLLNALPANAAALNTLTVFPNPSNGPVQLKNTGTAAGQLRIFDLNGRLILNDTLNGGEQRTLTLVNSSVYLYEFLSSGNVQQGKIVIR